MYLMYQCIVGRLLTTEQKKDRMSLLGDLIGNTDNDPGVLNKFITMMKRGVNILTSNRSMRPQHRSPPARLDRKYFGRIG
ncbi:hypothetical protein TNIN_499721 [Trichonephila inaurata madagascariensis]|uniref:Uncharacterized protein n=1 Tax=Trichonephila inaurata madagascariensis TaxID=2747483 RepID=A0A8X6ID60_9ARAC|nr:hypothetical protein TNIN_499721 [Trichonephila inaurata madagascariensis]